MVIYERDNVNVHEGNRRDNGSERYAAQPVASRVRNNFHFFFRIFFWGGREMLFTTRPQGAAIYESTAHTKLKRRKRNETAACVFGGREKHRHYSHLLLLLTALLHLPTARCLLKVKYVSSLRLKVKYST